MTKKFVRHTPKKEKNEKPLGQQLIEQAKKIDGYEVPVLEIINEAHADYSDQLIECVQHGIDAYGTRNFFVTILQKTERMFPDVTRLYFIPRLSCPTPTYDQIVYKYHAQQEELEFLWVVPDKDIAQAFKLDPLSVPDEEKELRQFVLDFYDGTLDALCKKLNKEKLYEPRISIHIDEDSVN